MKTRFTIGETGFVVRHTPWRPTPEEVAKIESDGSQPIEEAYRRERLSVFRQLTKAVKFARRAIKTDYFGVAEITECTLVNPYPEIPDCRIRREALEWKPVPGGYEAEIS